LLATTNTILLDSRQHSTRSCSICHWSGPTPVSSVYCS